MTPLLEQFISESRDFLPEINEKLMRLETEVDNAQVMNELFRLVHTLKGNSGLFDFPEMTRVLHACEDLLDAVRDNRAFYSETMADYLLEAMDFTGMLLDEIESSERIDSKHARLSTELTALLMCLIESKHDPIKVEGLVQTNDRSSIFKLPNELDSDLRKRLYRTIVNDSLPVVYIEYAPESECFFKGEDPFFQVRQIPEIMWRSIEVIASEFDVKHIDPYQCGLKFRILCRAEASELQELFRYTPEQVKIISLTPEDLLPSDRIKFPEGIQAERTDQTLDELGAGKVLALTEEQTIALREILCAQRDVLAQADDVPWLKGRLRSVAVALTAIHRALGRIDSIPMIEAALNDALAHETSAPLQEWLEKHAPETALISTALEENADVVPKFGRRAEDVICGPKTLKVDQEKIDRLMALIGEMVVAKNSLPYLALRAENQFGSRELAREIKTEYAVINRIAEEMQDAIMQVRMLPVSFIFQRFPRLVRDISKRLGKQVTLVMEGENTEADKNIVEALADPLIHIIRNSLDHGIEMPDAREASGKSKAGRLTIRAGQESDRVVIEITDDGRGIDPEIVKRKAYEKGLIDKIERERMSDREAVNLVFAAGFSTAAKVSELSGRGVGMDVVRNAVEKVNGTVVMESDNGKGTRVLLSLPLSMAVTNVMIIESNNQIFGVPMDMVVETVRVSESAIQVIKKRQAAVLRGRIVPLLSLNRLLGISTRQRLDDDNKYATLVVRIRGEQVGVLVDNFHETVDIILKPVSGILSGLNAYAGSALLGDGSVLMVLNPKELV